MGLSPGCRSGRNGVYSLINVMGPCAIVGAFITLPTTRKVLVFHDDALRKEKSNIM